ncbi:PiggyBac transposable element-derived protein 3 [Trichinella zimbabwensis]|uniref:PiggyBac transposable element-derived protein 3 n=1 Tax=Trichinella zimbabwensis TaxID=268475 RepID=A0A0V1H8J1_9BILA|nr:PiggyBac transposable element-derived protein 3 [Trichinella zimbabwensis]
MKPEVIMKKCRGYFEHACDGEMYVSRWNDSAAVTIASNYYTHFPVGTVKRFSRAVKKHVDVAEPNIIRVPPGNHHPFIAREAIRKKPPRATVTLTNEPPDIARTLPPIMCPRTMCSLPKKLQK